WLRFVTGPVLVLTGGGAALAALGVVRDPSAAAGSAVASATGVLGSGLEADATAWPLLTLVPALAVAAVGVLVLVAGGSWPRRDLGRPHPRGGAQPRGARDGAPGTDRCGRDTGAAAHAVTPLTRCATPLPPGRTMRCPPCIGVAQWR